MSKKTVKEKIKDLNRATESFRATKKQLITRICSVGVKRKILKYPSLIVAMLAAFLLNIVFYLCLFFMTNKKRATAVAIGLVAVIVFIVLSAGSLRTNRFYTKTAQVYTSVADTENADDIGWYELIDVDFQNLSESGEDVIGWISFENVDISYPILWGTTNDEYAKSTYLKEKNRAGSIFLDSRNSPDFSDYHSLIYGRNMHGKRMFGRLSAYCKDTSFYSGHEYFQILTPTMKYRYEIISCKEVKADDMLFDLSKVSEYDCNDYVRNILLNGSSLGLTVTAYERDHFVTLSTSNGNKRYVVTAFLVSEMYVD